MATEFGRHRKSSERKRVSARTVLIAGAVALIAFAIGGGIFYSTTMRAMAPADPGEAAEILAALDASGPGSRSSAFVRESNTKVRFNARSKSNSDPVVPPDDSVTLPLGSSVAVVTPSLPSPEGAEYVLILGVDRRSGRSRSQSDTILLMRIERGKKRVSMLSIPRDTLVEVPGYGVRKINSAHFYGGPALAIQTIKSYTGLPVHHYVKIEFTGFVGVVDAIGGVWIDVDQAIDDPMGATTGGVSNVTQIPAGRQKLSGTQALTYVRTRRAVGSDFTRIKHQQQFLKAVATQALATSNWSRLPSVVTAVANNVETDMSGSSLLSFARAFRSFDGSSARAYTAPGTSANVNGVACVIADKEASEVLFRAFAAGEEP